MKWCSCCFESSDKLTIPINYITTVMYNVWLNALFGLDFVSDSPYICLFFSRFTHFCCPGSEWVKVAVWIMPFLIFKTKESNWLSNCFHIYFYLQLSLIHFLNNQTGVLPNMYLGKPWNSLKKNQSKHCFSSSKFER
jgi:hypothetical protein